MLAVKYNSTDDILSIEHNFPKPIPSDDEVLIRVLRAGICSTDIEITRGYVSGYNQVLGHEFVGIVESSPDPQLLGKRVVGEINCNCAKFSCNDAIFQRNHAPGRTVLGIISKDGCLAQYITLPIQNLHLVPEHITDAQACFAEPLAAACRIIEQGLPPAGAKVAVIGDGKLGLLVAQVLASCAQGCAVTLLGRHADKMRLVSGLSSWVEAGQEAAEQMAGQFDVVVEASGSSHGIRSALQLTRPLGTVVLKSTVSLNDPHMPGWSELANDIVVNEKTLVGSRCGPIDLALKVMTEHAAVRGLLDSMLTATYPAGEAMAAFKRATTKGVLKVQLVFDA